MQNKIFKALQYFRRILSKIDLKIYAICVLISSFIWLIMTLSDNYTKRIEFPVSYSNFPKGMILVNNPSNEISFDIKSQGFELASVAIANRDSIKIDLSNVDFRKTKFNRYVAAIATRVFRYNIMNQIKVDDVGKDFKPDSLYLIFDSLITKELPIKLNSRITFQKGYNKYGDFIVSPASIKVKGPALSFRKIKYIDTDSLIAKELNSDLVKEVKLRKLDKYFSYSNNTVKVRVKTERYSEFSRWVPVIVNSNVPNIKVKTFPSKVKLTFSMALPDYKLLTDSSFKVVVQRDSIDLLKQDRLILKLTKEPKGIGYSNMNAETVDYILIDK